MGLRTVSDGRGADRSVAITLTRGFELAVAGERMQIPRSVERLLALLALSGRSIGRMQAAGTLWLDASDIRAASNLRTCLWRLNRSGPLVVVSAGDRVALAPGVAVDFDGLVRLASRVIGNPDHDDLARIPELIDAGELLPDWDDEWVVADRERFRLLRLEALERAGLLLLQRADYARALEAALCASLAEPLRESARRLLIQIHLAEGNVAEALGCYRDYRHTLRVEIGLEPSRAMEELIRPFAGSRLTVA